jgi:F-type H+-transporting ATPase subunit delta
VSSSKKLVTTYAKSLFQNVNSLHAEKSIKESFEVSQITVLDQNTFIPSVYIVGEELLLLRSTLISSKKLKEVFTNPTYAEKQKLDIILSIFPGLTITTKAFLKVLTERSHLSLIPEICDEYNHLLLKFQHSTKVKLITASILQEEYGSLLLKTLKTITGAKEVILNIAYNPKLLGGIIVEYNSTSIDASVLKEFSLFFNEN